MRFETKESLYFEMYKKEADPQVQLKLLELADKERTKAWQYAQLNALVDGLARKINETSEAGDLLAPPYQVEDVLANIDLLADKCEIDEGVDAKTGEQKKYTKLVLSPAVANAVWQIVTEGRGSVDAISKIDKSSDTVHCRVVLKYGDRTVVGQSDSPILHMADGWPDAEAQRTANLKLGKCLAECYRRWGIGYYPSPKEDKDEETSVYTTGYVEDIETSSKSEEKPESKPATPIKKAKEKARKKKDANEDGSTVSNTAVSSDVKPSEEPKEPAALPIPDGYPSVEEALKVKSSLSNGTFGDLSKPLFYLGQYVRLAKNNHESETSHEALEMRALHVLIANHPELADDCRKYQVSGIFAA